jgi:hypothetical protein
MRFEIVGAEDIAAPESFQSEAQTMAVKWKTD